MVCSHYYCIALDEVMFMRSVLDKLCIKWIAASESVGIIAALLTMEGMQRYSTAVEKSALTPPGWVFSVVWTILYAIMGIGVCLVVNSDAPGNKERCVNLFVAQLVINFFWPLFFFNAQAYAAAFAVLMILWILVLLMTLCFAKINTAAAWLQVPYLIWLCFAAYLNAAAWLLNS